MLLCRMNIPLYTRDRCGAIKRKTAPDMTETTKGKEDLCWLKEGDCMEHSNHVGQEAETNSDMKGPEQDPDHRDTPPVTYFLKPGPVFHSSNASQQSVQILNPSMD
jgi:hypothetical protein